MELSPIIVNAQYSVGRSRGYAGHEPGFEGKVMSVNEQSNFVIVDVERSLGLRAGDTLGVYHGVDYIARLEVLQVRWISRYATSRSSRPRSKSAIPLDKEGPATSKALQIPDVKNGPSINDVARRAKVSITTVSRVINNFTSVSTRNRARVEEAIAYYK